jgi:hypothetical protein
MVSNKKINYKVVDLVQLSLQDIDALPSMYGTRQKPKYTRQRLRGKFLADKMLFAECYFSSTRQKLCRVLALGKDFVECRHSTKIETKSSKKNPKKREKISWEASTRQPLSTTQVLDFFFASLWKMGSNS